MWIIKQIKKLANKCVKTNEQFQCVKEDNNNIKMVLNSETEATLNNVKLDNVDVTNLCKENEDLKSYIAESHPNEKYDIICDIETLGLTSDCLVWEIAACVFERSTHKKIMSFHKCVDLTNVGNIIIDGNTLVWWLKTNPTLLYEKISGKADGVRYVYSEEELCKDFLFWLYSISDATYGLANWENIYFWGNGILFDNRFIKDKFQQYDVVYPIIYRNDRDIRTLVGLAAEKTGCKTDKEFREKYVLANTTEHNAFDDVMNEYEAMKAAWKVLGDSNE